MKTIIEILGWIATIGSVLMYAPQTIKTCKTKSASSLSPTPFMILALGSVLWALVCAMINSYQGWVTNIIVLILMTPIFYYMFNKNFKIFIPILIGIIVVIAAASTLMFLKFDISFWVKLPLNLIAGLCTGFGLLPQAIKIFKEREVKDYSLVTGVLIMSFNIVWVLYWAGKACYITAGNGATYEQNLSLMIISAILSFSGLITQLPVMYTYLKYEKKSKNA